MTRLNLRRLQLRACAAAVVLLAGVQAGLASHVSQLDETGDVITPSSTLLASGTLHIPPDITDARAIDGVVRTHNPPDAPADADHGLIFSNDDTRGNPQILTVSNLSSPLSGPAEIRIYTITSDPGRTPSAVTIRSSTSVINSLNPSDYDTLLAENAPLSFSNPALLAPGEPPSDQMFANVFVAAPLDTKSLFLDFAGASGLTYGGARISELQAIVPEPASLSLLGLAAAAMLARRRRT